MSRERSSYAADVRPVAPGVLHSPFVCAWCGGTKHLRPTVLGFTRVEAAVCDDVVACARRQLRKAKERSA